MQCSYRYCSTGEEGGPMHADGSAAEFESSESSEPVSTIQGLSVKVGGTADPLRQFPASRSEIRSTETVRFMQQVRGHAMVRSIAGMLRQILDADSPYLRRQDFDTTGKIASGGRART